MGGRPVGEVKPKLEYIPDLSKLRFVGRKAAVYGVNHGNVWWHIMRPGTFTPNQNVWHYCVGRTFCGGHAVTNGYAQDYRPGDVCPACLEQL
jgi:hypothetical protein